MITAVRIELDDEQLEELAERIAAKLRPAPRARKAPMPHRIPRPEAVERMSRKLRRKGLR